MDYLIWIGLWLVACPPLAIFAGKFIAFGMGTHDKCDLERE